MMITVLNKYHDLITYALLIYYLIKYFPPNQINIIHILESKSTIQGSSTR